MTTLIFLLAVFGVVASTLTSLPETHHLRGTLNSELSGPFTAPLAIDMDYYSKASYCDVEKIRSWSCGSSCQYHANMQQVTAVNNKGKEGQGYCGYDAAKNRVVVAFRGSDNLKNWIDNIQFIPVSYPRCAGCKVHDGFVKTLNQISDQLNVCVSNLANQYPSATVVITGHSLGGALATIYALEVAQFVHFSRIYFINFGSPRVGNKAFVEYFQRTIPVAYRVVNYRDIVPHMPPEHLLGFIHINTEAFFEKDSATNFKICESREDSKCSYKFDYFSSDQHTNYFGFYTGC